MTPDEPSSTAPVTSVLADCKFGYWVSLATGFTTLLTFVVAVATPPLSGPWCKAGCFTYPYADIAARFPRDYLWMFLAVPATLLFVAFVLALQARARLERRLIGQLGVVFSAMAALTLLGDYFVQLAVIQPSVLAGEVDGISLLTQYNPHGIFIALEELGYLLMAASLAAMAPVLASSTRLERTVGSFFVGGLVLALAALAWFTLRYGHERAYLFEIAIISIVWLTLIPTAFMMAAVFRRDLVTRR